MRMIREGWEITRRRAGSAKHEAGVVMMFVLMAILIIGAITLSVIQLISADVAGGLRELQAEQVFNIAQAGVHYAIGQLELSGANSYTGQAITITSGSTTLGTATITVNCIDTGAAPPCSGTYAGYRRIISVGTLPVGGPTRKIVAVVQGSTGSSYAYCSSSGFTGQGTTVSGGSVGSNGSITLQNSTVSGNINSDGSEVLQSTTATGSAEANGSITCQSCTVQGGTTPDAGLGTVCPAVSVGPFTPGAGSTTVLPGNSLTLVGGTNYGSITLMGGTCPNYTNLYLQAGASGTTTVIQVNSITMQGCSRVVVSGAGNIDLRLGSAATGLTIQLARFGAASSDTYTSPQRVLASQLKVEAKGSITIQSPDQYAVGNFILPNGTFTAQSAAGVYGAVVTGSTVIQLSFGLTYDTSLSSSTSFNNLRSWKDQ
jgi:type II secretory pathway pseudopilin PulG